MREKNRYAESFMFYCILLAANRIITGQLLERYIGCFVENGNDQKAETVLERQPNLTIDICIEKCYNETSRTIMEMTFAALTNGRRCTCRNNSGQQLPDHTCNVQCSGNPMQKCGGSSNDKFYSLYTVCPVGFFGTNCYQSCHCKRHLPCDRKAGICPDGCDDQWNGTNCNISNIQKQYIGCYGDGPYDYRVRNAMDVRNPGGKTGETNQYINSNEFCIDVCSNNNYTYAGMQYGYDCNCGEKYDKYGNKTHDGRRVNCNDPARACPANRNQKCGGSYANSVYYVCPVGFYGRLCVNRCHCSNGDPCRFNGSCLNSTLSPCKPGWTGSACNTRDCRINNGDCKFSEKCENVDLGYANWSVCRCKDGTYSFGNTCRQNVDECQAGASSCDTTSENCIDTIGSYKCDCKDGFTLISGKCEDVDECRSDFFLCDRETKLCNNTIGSYTCYCKLGYENTIFGNCTDVDECQTGTSSCSITSENCFNSIGSYKCECKDGFANIFGKCKDVDECQLSRSSSPCDAFSHYCINSIGSYICPCREGFANISGKCEEFNNMPTTGIIFGFLLAISLLINALFVFFKIKSAKPIKPEPVKGMTESDAKPSYVKTPHQQELIYDEIQASVYEPIVLEKRQIVQSATSEYAALQRDDYLNVESSI